MPDKVQLGKGSRPEKAAESRKFSSILAYLDHVSENVPTKEESSTTSRGVPQHAFDVSSSISSSEPQQQGRHRQRARQDISSLDRHRGSGAQLTDDQVRATRAPWDSSKKKEARTTRSIRGSPTPTERREAAAGRGGSRRARGGDRTTTPTPTILGEASGSGRTRGVGDRYSTVGGSSSLDGNFTAGGGGGSGSGRGDGKVDAFEKTLDHYSCSSSASMQEGLPTVVVGQRRRWVWDEWEADPSVLGDKTGGGGRGCGWGGHSSSGDAENRQAPALSAETFMTAATRGEGRRETPSSTPLRAGGDGTTTVAGGTAVASQPWALTRGMGETPDGCAPAVRQAFEDVQTTAQAMRADLKERRSEVRAN